MIDADLGFASTAWAGAAMTAVAIGLVVVAMRLHGGSRVVTKSVAGEPALGTEHVPPARPGSA